MASHGSSFQKVFMGGAGSGSDPLYIENIFNTQVYTGSGANRSIVNNLDLSNEGGLVWLKDRGVAYNHWLCDTVMGATKHWSTDNSRIDTVSTGLTGFNNNGFSLGNWQDINTSGAELASWSWRKAPKFFDIVSYTGNSTGGRTISHNLGCDVGMVIIHSTSVNRAGVVWHRGFSNTSLGYMYIGGTAAEDLSSNLFNSTAPTDSVITLGTNALVNSNSETYVAYVFAHNNNNGGFGLDADQDVIKCGTYTGDGGAGTTEVNLGFEPQWILVKARSAADNWFLIDNKRGWVTHDNQSNDAYVLPNAENAESTGGFLDITGTGFKTTLYTNVNVNSRDYIYMAIRRGPMAVPTDASKVFHIETRGATAPNPPAFNASFDPDFVFRGVTSAAYSASRLTQGEYMALGSTAAATSASNYVFDFHHGFHNISSTSTSDYYYGWGRAPGFFDVAAWKGTGSNATIAHNLGVAPEMIWVKRRDGTASWTVLTNFTSSAYDDLLLNTTVEKTTRNYNNNQYLTGAPTATGIPFANGYGVNVNSEYYVGYFFATLAGISKIGTFTGNGGSQNIDCGFSNGAKFILVKPLSTGSFAFWDTARGIAAGNETSFKIDDSSGLTGDAVDALSSGFTVNNTGNITNVNGTTYLFYAIAA